jgi:hypothetical protein
MEDSAEFSSEMPPCGCPVCGKMLDAAKSLETGGRPKANDFSICLYCSSVLRFRPDMVLERITTQDLRDLFENDPRGLVLLVKAVQGVRMHIHTRTLMN